MGFLCCSNHFGPYARGHKQKKDSCLGRKENNLKRFCFFSISKQICWQQGSKICPFLTKMSSGKLCQLLVTSTQKGRGGGYRRARNVIGAAGMGQHHHQVQVLNEFCNIPGTINSTKLTWRLKQERRGSSECPILWSESLNCCSLHFQRSSVRIGPPPSQCSLPPRLWGICWSSEEPEPLTTLQWIGNLCPSPWQGWEPRGSPQTLSLLRQAQSQESSNLTLQQRSSKSLASYFPPENSYFTSRVLQMYLVAPTELLLAQSNVWDLSFHLSPQAWCDLEDRAVTMPLLVPQWAPRVPVALLSFPTEVGRFSKTLQLWQTEIVSQAGLNERSLRDH